MLPEITQDNVYIFIPYKVAKITTAIRQDSQMSLKEALLSFYRSNTYRLLEQENTKLWHLSPAQIYVDFLRPRQSQTDEDYSSGG